MSGEFTIRTSALVPDGTLIWTRGAEVIGVDTSKRRDWLSMFGLAVEAPPRADGVTVSPVTYEHIKASGGGK